MNDAIQLAAARYVMTAQGLVSAHIVQAGGDVVDRFIYYGVLSASIAHVDFSPDAQGQWATLSDPKVPQEKRRPITIRALAASLGMPRQTVWRRLQRLIAAEMIEHTGGGIRTARSDPRSAIYDTALATNTGLLAAFLRAGPLDDPERDRDRRAAQAVLARSDPPHRAIGRLCTTFVLYAISEFARRTTGDLVDGYVQLGLTTACAGQVRGEGLALLPAVPVRDVAEITGLAEETTRRRLHALAQTGFAERTPRGFAPTWLSGDDPAGLRGAMEIGVTRLMRQVARL